MKFADSTLRNKSIAFTGEISHWPIHYLYSPVDIADIIGSQVTETLDKNTDYLVVGSKRKKGKAASIRKAESLQKDGSSIQVIDEEKYIYLTRPDIAGAQFVFAGGFEYCPAHVVGGNSYSSVENIGGNLAPAVTEKTNYLVIGGKRGKGKAAAENAAKKLEKEGHTINRLSEEEFIELVSCNLDVEAIDFQGLVMKLHSIAVGTRLSNSMKMLRDEQVHLYSDVNADRVSGIVHSQSGGGVYSCTLGKDGEYGCCDQVLDKCWSSQGHTMCKHLLVLVLGLVRNGELEAPKAFNWIKEAQANRPIKEDSSELAKTIVRYKGMQQGELDWRPTETIPEDFLAY